MPLSEMANLFNSFHLIVSPGLVSASSSQLLTDNILGYYLSLYEFLLLFNSPSRTQILIIWLQAQLSTPKAHGPCYAWYAYNTSSFTMSNILTLIS